MPGRTTYEAWESYAAPLNKALLCIARQRNFVLKELAAGLIPGVTYAVTLNNMNSVLLSTVDTSTPKVYLVAGQTIGFSEWHPDVPAERFRVQTLSYTYGFTTRVNHQEVELLMFQWKRARDPAVLYPSGHLHVGAGLLANPTIIRPGSFHKAHIPTQRLSFESIVRFAITELDVKPVHRDWRNRLDASEASFAQPRI